MSIVDSDAVFRSRLLGIGLDEAVHKALVNSGIKTMGNFAFASSYVPGSSDDGPFVKLIKEALGKEPNIGELAGLRRLFNESYAATSAEMKTMVEQSEDNPVRKLAPAERAERFHEQQTRMKGLTISGHHEPADSLVDAAVNIYESDRLRYVPWENCISREHEVTHAPKKDHLLSFDSSGTLKMSKKDQVTPCEVSTDLQLKYCLVRRGLALEQANVMSYANHEMWAERMFTSRLRDPPPGYAKVTFRQLQLADAKLFVVLGEKTRTGIKATCAGRPCDAVFLTAMDSPEVQHLLQPMPATNAKPERSMEYPMGIPDLSPSDQVKVDQANVLYQNCFAFAQTLVQDGDTVTIENPGNSWLWELPCAAPLLDQCNFVDMDACMHGGTRKKFTSLLTNKNEFAIMGVRCDDSHDHEAWGLDENSTFNTSKEAQYPPGFCESYCKVLTQLAQDKGWFIKQSQQLDTSVYKPFVQPRGRKVPQPVSEYLKTRSITVDKKPPVSSKNTLTVALSDIPIGSKLLRTEAKEGAGGKSRVLCVFGIFRSPSQFVEASRSIKHPFDDFMHVPDLLLRCIFDIVTWGPVELTRFQLKALNEMKEKRALFKDDEARLHEKVPSHMKHLVKDKQFLLIRHLAESIGRPDELVHEEMVEGFKLVGEGKPSRVFKVDVRPATMSVEELDSKAKFAVRQKEKLRPIDNFAENCVNDAWSCPEKIDLHALDQLVWLISLLYNLAEGKGFVEIPLKDGSRLEGRVHPDWNMEFLRSLITTVDLKDAYKQFGIHESDRCRAVVALKSYNQEGLALYSMNCLPFGAASSVHSFNRISRMVWGIGVTALKLPWVNYFDDYPLIAPRSLAVSTLSAAKGMLHLLGIKFSEQKLNPMSESAEVLGVVVECSKVASGEISFKMKESRREETLKEIEDMTRARKVVPASLPSFLGRLQFADGQLAGRMGKLAMSDLRELGLQSKLNVTIPDDKVEALKCLSSLFSNNVPKTFNMKSESEPILIFTDGSAEPCQGGVRAAIGGVLIDGSETRVFGCLVVVEASAVPQKSTFLFIDNWGVLDSYIPGTASEKTWREMLVEIERVDFSYPSYIWAARVPSQSNPSDPPSRGHMEGLEFIREHVLESPKCPLTGEMLVSSFDAEADLGKQPKEWNATANMLKK
eukprot:s119_g46.t1